ncbi:MAG TPA: dienelactone hydrolase family protein [Thermoanaerobaculia bacterium]
MGEKVQFPSNGHTCEGYLAPPRSGSGPAVVVIQEWWGLVPHIEDVVERFSKEGFIAIAPDLYHGQKTTSPDTAAKLLMELDVERAGKEIAGAGDYLLSRPECMSKTFGVVGFCMGGALAQYAATSNSKVGAAASFYGGFKKVPLDWEKLNAPLLLFYGESDRGVSASQGIELEKQLRKMGKNADTVTYPGADHAFFNDTRPEAYNKKAAEDAWGRVVRLFKQNVK